MMLYAIFTVCVIGTSNCEKRYSELPRPPGIPEAQISDTAMQQMCLDNNRGDHAFDNPVIDPKGRKVKITPTDCVLGNAPPAGTLPANSFIGYHE
jgi:hypothetical protein